MKSGMQINIKGIVQGVGFRPFIYNLAKEFDLTGWVLNDTSGVSIEVEGKNTSVDCFIEGIRTRPPVQAVIFDMQHEPIRLQGFSEFEIRKSESQEDKFVPISPEIATCQDCLTELFDPNDRRFRYPFINCTNCGPRFTIIKDIPYDRPLTTMAPFIMCEKCQAEYDDPGDRRFHAQPNACPVCGPGLTLLDEKRNKIDIDDVITEVCTLLKAGKIIAIKGLGGFHLACDAMNETAVSRLRARKYREYKPFAIMVQDIETAKRLCFINKEEERLLNGTIRPIVLLNKRKDCPVAKDVAPYQKYHGVMLPYTPLHHVIVAESRLVLVMTSGNISSEPIVYYDDEAFERLNNIADYYLLHNREIHTRTDDSVFRVWRNEEVALRRSRGYAPYPLLLPFRCEAQILGCGAELKNTFCITRENFAFMSHHIGDLENLETLTSFEEGINHFKKIFYIDPAYISYDLHPEYLSTKYALALKDIPKIGIQHHHAHIVSCMGDNGIDGDVIGVSFDGTGYGTDGKIWGGEFLVCDYADFKRAAHLEYIPLPGGEQAIKEPWRMAASYLYKAFGDEMLELKVDFIDFLKGKKWATLKKMIDKGVNSPMTSSAGRLFDAVSALLGVRREVYYEGQAAIELEMAADSTEGSYPFEIEAQGGKAEILLTPLISEIVSDISVGLRTEIISSKFHNTVADIISNMCHRIRQTTGLERVVLSGGVFQNGLLADKVFERLNADGFKIFTHHKVPPNDGGIALGQVIIANERIKLGKV